MSINLNRLKQGINNLPGASAHAKMTPAYRKTSQIIPETAIQSAVCILLHRIQGKLHFPLVIRSSQNQNDRHKGQIGLPGGRFEPQDATLFNCAIRETEEEIGIQQSKIQLITELSPLYIDVSNFVVAPFLSESSTVHQYQLQPTEIDEIFEFPLEALFDPSMKKKKNMQIRGLTYKDIPYYHYKDHVIWGATAMILSELESLLSDYR